MTQGAAPNNPTSANWWAESGAPAPSACLQYTATGSSAVNLITFSVVKKETWTEDAEVTEHPVELGSNVADHVRVALVKCSLDVYMSNEPIGLLSTYVGVAKKPLNLPIDLPSWQSAGPLQITYPTWENNILARALLQTATGAVGSAIGGAGGVVGSALGGVLGALLLAGKEVDASAQTDAGLENQSTTWPTALTEQWAADTDYAAAMQALLIQLKNAAQTFTVFGSKRAPLNPMVIESLTFARDNGTGSGIDISIGLKEVRQVTTQTVPAPIPALPSGGGTQPVARGGQDPAPAAPTVSAAAMLLASAKSLAASLSGSPGVP